MVLTKYQTKRRIKMTDFIKIAETSELENNQVKKFEINDTKIALFKIEDNFYATSDTCTHAEASISEGEIEDDTITCPHHGAKFNIKTGAALTLPAMMPLETFEIKVEGNEVLIKT